MKLRIRDIKDPNEGAAGIIVAVLMIGLILSAFAFVQTVYIPQWMEQKEAEHMDDLANQFSQLKFAIDTLTVAEQANVPISSPITLGSKEMPFLHSVRAYGSLEILPNDCKITITDNLGQTFNYDLGSIKYESDNAYYLDQKYIFENGAIILSQESGDVIAIRPGIFVQDSKDLYFNVVKLTGIGDKTSVSGYGTFPVQSKFSKTKDYAIPLTEIIVVYTSHVNAWKLYFEDILSDPAFDVDITENTAGDGITIKFNSDYPIVEVKETEVDVQISPGWVE